MKNPVEQELYVVLDTYSDRNYPRAKCTPNNYYGVYLKDSSGKQLDSQSTYYYGFATVG